ncbi:MAG: T9SS type A sorting domain-containing protein [Bacteroidota bacterium]
MRGYILCLILLMVAHFTWATHIVGGHIDIRAISGLTYQINVTLWMDTGSSVAPSISNLYVNGELIDVIEPFTLTEQRLNLGFERSLTTYSTMYNFPSPGIYEVGYTEFNRDAGMLNFSNSVDTPFFIKTSFKIDPVLGSNETPRTAPFFWGSASVGQDFHFDPAIRDTDGDSLSFHLAVPYSSDSAQVDDYQFMSGFADDLYVSPISGQFSIINPKVVGKYTLALTVREWRDLGEVKTLLSESIYDIYINVRSEVSSGNVRIDVPDFKCMPMGEIREINVRGASGTKVYISSDYDGIIYVNGRNLSAVDSITLNTIGRGDFSIEFPEDGSNTGHLGLIYLVVMDTSNQVIGSRSLLFSADCTSLSPAIISSVNEIDIPKINFYPNPVTDVLNVDLKSLLGLSVKIQMYNSIGREVYWDSIIATDQPLQFAVAGLPKGIYLLKLAYDKKQHVERIVLD